jgi:hypothetical protein
MTISGALRTSVVVRAANRCEYCQLSQLGQEATFHVDHVVPLTCGGPADLSNLALACVGCSLHKSAKARAIDPESGDEVSLFNPRSQKWSAHFRWEKEEIVGTTQTGRATVAALRMNRALILSIRREEIRRGRLPRE